jgi:hypothetical protein
VQPRVVHQRVVHQRVVHPRVVAPASDRLLVALLG